MIYIFTLIKYNIKFKLILSLYNVFFIITTKFFIITIKKSCLIYDTNERATIEQLLKDPYFHHDHWATNFEVKLKQVLEKDREQNDKIRKKKMKKVISFICISAIIQFD